MYVKNFTSCPPGSKLNTYDKNEHTGISSTRIKNYANDTTKSKYRYMNNNMMNTVQSDTSNSTKSQITVNIGDWVAVIYNDNWFPGRSTYKYICSCFKIPQFK